MKPEDLGIKKGDFFLWYEDELNWGVMQLVAYHPDGGVYEGPNQSNVLDMYVINKVNEGPAGLFIKSLQDAVEKEGKEGGSWYHGFQSNIAMAFVDAFDCNKYDNLLNLDKEAEYIHAVANQAAKNFLDMLIHKPSPEDPDLPGMLELQLRNPKA